METFHPVAAHFAVVLPLVALLLEITALVLKKRVFSHTATFTLVVATLMVALAYLTGTHDAKEGVAEVLKMYSTEGAEELVEHARLGFNLLIAMSVVSVLKLVTLKVNNTYLAYTVLAGMVAVTLLMFVQGKHGGEVVYKYGTLFKAYEIKDTLKEALKENEPLEDANEKAQAYEDAIKEALGVEEE